MKYSIITNYHDYNSKISCNNKGVITLTLTPTNINDISLSTNIITKSYKTSFDNIYCTEYFRKGNEFLYKYTKYKPNNRFVSSNDYKVISTSSHVIPVYTKKFDISRYKYIKNSIYKHRYERLYKKLNSYKNYL